MSWVCLPSCVISCAGDFILTLPGYFSLRFPHERYHKEFDVKCFLVYTLLGIPQTLVPQKWKVRVCARVWLGYPLFLLATVVMHALCFPSIVGWV